MSLLKAPSGEDIDVLARTIFGEARGETLEGQIAVAYVALHRALIAGAQLRRAGKQHRLYGNGTIASACKAPWQFSCWNPGNPTLEAMLAADMNMPAFQRAMHIATGVALRLLSDALPTSTHYYAPAKVKPPPLWVTGRAATAAVPAIRPARELGTIGGHAFFGDVS